MKAISIIDRFVFFCNLEDVVANDIPKLVNHFDGYKMNQRQEATAQGSVTVTTFANKNYAVSFRKNRIDIEYANNPQVVGIPSLEYTVSELKRFKELYPNIVGNRVSYISTAFIPNPNNEPLVDMMDNLGLTSAFGPSNEFTFRINSPIKIAREQCNAVLNIQQGNVQDQNKKNLPAIICVNDINTIATDTTNRFELDGVAEIFNQMVVKVIEKNDKVLALIENATIAS